MSLHFPLICMYIFPEYANLNAIFMFRYWTAGTVDFQCHGLTTISGGPAGSNWETAYGANYHCQTAPPETTQWRYDDPITYHGNSNLPPPQVMSIFTLGLGNANGDSTVYHYATTTDFE
jgi:hypothetical protein